MQNKDQMIKQLILDKIEKDPQAFLFLSDFDGTLADMHPIPSQAYINSAARAALANMMDATMIVTGRDLGSLDRLMNPPGIDSETIKLPAISEHGAVWRINDDVCTRLSDNEKKMMAAYQNEAEAFAKKLVIDYHLNDMTFHHPDTEQDEPVQWHQLVETTKISSLAIHYRALQGHSKLAHIQSDMKAFMEDCAENLSQFKLDIGGQMVYELKRSDISKGDTLKMILDNHYKQSTLLVWAADHLGGTDGSAAEEVHLRDGYVLQVKNPDDPERYVSNEHPGRNPDVFFESPVALADFIEKMSLTRTQALQANRASELMLSNALTQ